MPPSPMATAAMRSSTLFSCLPTHLPKASILPPNLPISPIRHHSSTPTSRTATPSSLMTFSPNPSSNPLSTPTRCLPHTRHASTTAPTVDDAPTTPATPLPSQSPSTTTPLTWTEFFALRKRRRVTNLITSSITGTASLFTGAAFLAGADLDGLGAQKFGLDPVIFAGMLTMACGSLGWLAGPFVGNGVWRVANRGRVEGFKGKEKAFYDRIKRYRADPASQSMNNPVPDYYGEKIGSVAAYRQWLKDQRAFTKKRQM